MKALYTPEPGVYGLVDRPMPTPGVDEALVKVTSSGLCHTDAIIREGVAGHVVYPIIPGHEFVGTVEACGPAVRHVAPGDRVAVHHIMACGECSMCRTGDTIGCSNYDELGARRDGGFAEYCAVPARHLYSLPDHVSNEEGAVVEPLANAVSVVRESDIRIGDRVVVIGPGPIGLLIVQVAKLANPSVLVLAGTRDERLALGAQLGATHTVNVMRDGAPSEIKDILGEQGADVVVESAGTRGALELALDVVGWRGRIVLEGVHPTDALTPISPYRFMYLAASMVGIRGWLTADFCRALELIASGLVNVKPLISHTFSLDQWETAFDMITNRKDEAMKVLFDLSGGSAS